VIRFLEELNTCTDSSWFMRWMLAGLMLKVAILDHSILWVVLSSLVFLSAFSGWLLYALRQLGVRG
jgi:hypothetical protein